MDFALDDETVKEWFISRFAQLYPNENVRPFVDHLNHRLNQYLQETARDFRTDIPLFDEHDVILITYGNSLHREGEHPLRTLHHFLITKLRDIINTVHILPFYPYSSDDGFSVIDYYQVDPALGTWSDIEAIRNSGFELMFDAVINHISAQSEWFQKFLQGDDIYYDYFIIMDPDTDLSQVTRPRALPLLTPVELHSETRYVWTTFSADQIDLNYANPAVLLEVIDLLLFYIEQGARIIRLDAVAFIWKEVGTSCIHLPGTHAIIQMLRRIIDIVAPGVLLLTETNVPHQENINYLGNGTNEAHMVYQFPLPPLIAHTILTEDASVLAGWASTLGMPGEKATFFNFCASHDGIGLRPVETILSQEQIDFLVAQTQKNGGHVSYKTNPDGSRSPYELNITYYDLLNGHYPDQEDDLCVQRFLCSQAILLAMAGLPAVYIHSLLGSRNDAEGVRQTGRARTINRERLSYQDVKDALCNPVTRRARIFDGYSRLILARRGERAFHPNAGQQVMDLPSSIFGVRRQSQDGSQTIMALHNVTSKEHSIRISSLSSNRKFFDCLQREMIDSVDTVVLSPFTSMWLREED